MKKLKLFLTSLSLISILFIGIQSIHATNTTVNGKHSITITGLDADWTATSEGHLYDLDIAMIIFYPSATGDIMIIHDGGIDGEEFFDSDACADVYDTRVIYYPPGTMYSPVIDITDCTLGTAANAKVKIYFR